MAVGAAIAEEAAEAPCPACGAWAATMGLPLANNARNQPRIHRCWKSQLRRAHFMGNTKFRARMREVRLPGCDRAESRGDQRCDEIGPAWGLGQFAPVKWST